MSDIIEQRSDEWKKLRLGLPTASRMADLMARTKSGYGASRANLMAALIAERLTGVPSEYYQNAAMQWGTDHEDEAVAAYSFYRNMSVEKVSFVKHPKMESGASPDVLVGTDGLAEIKCPLTATHIETLLGGTVPEKYVLQMQWQMECTGRKWCDFVSYDPRLPEHLRLVVERVIRDDKRIQEIGGEVEKFIQEMMLKLARLEKPSLSG